MAGNLFLPILFLSLLVSSALALSLQREERDPRRRRDECLQECRREQREETQEHRRECERRCREQYERAEQEQGGRGGNPVREERSPYFFREEEFRRALRTEHGNLWMLSKFHEKSELLLGIANYRLAVLEMNPSTFALPHHCDAETIFYVSRGRGTIGLLRAREEQQQETTHEIKEGDILRVRTGTIVYIANRDSNEKLYIIKLLKPVSIPTEVEAYFGFGGEQESYMRSFSKQVLEAAFNIEADEVERVFGKQGEAIIEAPEEKIREMGRRSSSEGGGRWPFGGQSRRPFNLLSQHPVYSNKRGELYEVGSKDCPELGEVDVAVSYLNLTAGSMLEPYFNSRSTKIAMVVGGAGQVEIVCPHMERERHEEEEREQEQQYEEKRGGEGRRRRQQQQQRYSRAVSHVSKGTVFVVPPGHPVVGIASRRSNNLQVVCFEVHAQNNERIFLAGGNNIWKQMGRVAKELAFGTSPEEVDKVLDAQSESVFVAGPEDKGEERRRGGKSLSSILAFAEF